MPDVLAATSKLAALESLLAEMGSVVVAYSGGVDSALLADVAFSVLGDRMVALIAASDSLAAEELAAATALAAERGFPLATVATRELDNPAYLANDLQRCYHCKSELFERAGAYARAHGFAWVADGFNAGDRSDHRPGKRAGDERGVRSPLAEVELDKEEIRALARERGLPVWDKPAMPCLSSRLPYGEKVTPAKLAQVAAAERCLHGLGFAQCRVRHHGDVARIEVPLELLPRLVDPQVRAQVVRELRAAGYRWVTLDLEGFRSGNLNPAAPPPGALPG